MNDGRVRAAIEQMEAWLSDVAWEPDPDALAQWEEEFRMALAQAEKGSGWAALIARAHEAGRMLEARIEVVAEARDRIKAELEAQEQGNRALRGYGANTR
ncbi:MAG: hypothetical protein IPN59_00615 [Holophaga sp.]|nr:hypothetical protein [Holophaga sp.]